MKARRRRKRSEKRSGRRRRRGGREGEIAVAEPEEGVVSKLKRKFTNAYLNVANKYRRKRGVHDLRVNPANGLPEFTFGTHSFTGPNTILDDVALARKPRNEIDAASKAHDLDYDARDRRKGTKKEQFRETQTADRKFLDEVGRHKGKSGYWPARLGIGAKYHVEKLLGRNLYRKGGVVVRPSLSPSATLRATLTR